MRRSVGRSTNLPRVTLDPSLDSIKVEPRILDVRAGARREAQVGVERRVPAGQEAGLDLRVLGQAGLAHALHGEGVLLESGGQGVLALPGVLLVEDLGAREGGAGDGVGEGLGLGLGGGRGGQGGLGFCRGGGGGEEGDFLRDGAAEVLEGLLDVRGVVVSFGGVVGAEIDVRQ